MEGDLTTPPCSPKAKRSKSSSSALSSPKVDRELDEEEQTALNEVESEITQLLSTGIQDASILDNDGQCAEVWSHIQSVYSEGGSEVNDEFGVDSRLKEVVRAYAEGSLLRLSDLMPKLRSKICTHCKEICHGLSDARFGTLIPVFVARKNLGEPFHSQNVVERVESNRTECMWVWEAPSIDVFPKSLQELMRSARDTRNLVSKRYKALVKVKEAIKSGDMAAKAAANEQLGAIYKKVLLEREKRERLEAKRAATEQNRQKLPSIFQRATQKRETKLFNHASPVRQPRTSTKLSAAGGPNPKSLLLNWLKSAPAASNATQTENNSSYTPKTGITCSSPVAEAGAKDTKYEQKPSEVEAIIGENEITEANESQLTELSEFIAKLPIKATRTNEDENRQKPHQSDLPSLGGFEEFKKMCEDHRESWMRYFTYVNTNRKFFVETSTNTGETATATSVPIQEQVSKRFLVDDIINNILDTTYGDPCLRQERCSRVFHMSDNDWKRPSMRLLISRTSQKISTREPMAIDEVMDYFADSDEEWFERYDVDDVDDSGSEEEDEEEEETDWIVQDNPEQGVQKHTQNLCEVVKVYCVNKSWHWIVDGIPQNNEECCSIEEAKKNGMNIEKCVYGFGYEGYTTNPISDFVSGMRGHRVIMTTEDVQDFLKYCHAKHTKKEDLMAEFKEMKPFCSMSDIKEKFRKYICRMKVDSTKQRWLVTTEAALLFGIRDELDVILAKELDEVGE